MLFWGPPESASQPLGQSAPRSSPCNDFNESSLISIAKKIYQCEPLTIIKFHMIEYDFNYMHALVHQVQLNSY